MHYYYWHSFYFLSTTWKNYFLIDLHYETQSESSDSVAFVRILWCSCRVQKDLVEWKLRCSQVSGCDDAETIFVAFLVHMKMVTMNFFKKPYLWRFSADRFQQLKPSLWLFPCSCDPVNSKEGQVLKKKKTGENHLWMQQKFELEQHFIRSIHAIWMRNVMSMHMKKCKSMPLVRRGLTLLIPLLYS